MRLPQAIRLPRASRQLDRDALLRNSDKKTIHIEVVDGQGNPVLEFDVSVDTANRSVHYNNGFGQRVTTDGSQNVTVSVGGQTVARLATTARAFDGRFDRVVLAR